MASLAPAVPLGANDAPSGLSAVPRVAWGTHLCQFFRTADDLASTLVPFFAAGLANHERCLWVTAPPLPAAAAKAALVREVPDADDRIRSGQLEILDFDEWYLRNAALTTEQVLEQWIEREQGALRDGYKGLRLTGNTSWLRRDQWEEFQAYERSVHRAFSGRRVVAVCSYSLAHCSSDEVLDVVRHHGSALARRDGEWSLIRSATETLAAVVDGGDGQHDAVLYDADDFPVERVGRFVAEGLRHGEGVVVVLGGDRDRSLRSALLASGLDVDRLLASGQLTWLDPERTLPDLLRDGALDADRFAARVPPILAASRARFGAVRVYGEMVDVLSRRGDFRAALELERLWNGLLRALSMPVLCTYDASAFDGEAGVRRLRDVSAEHRTVHRGERSPHSAALRGLVHELAEKTRALDAEAALRAAAESERDRWRTNSREALAHVSRLQRVTSALLVARTPAEIGNVVVTAMAEATGASRALLASAGAGAAPVLVAHTGCPTAVREDGPGLFVLGAGSPLCDALCTGRPVVLGSPEQIAERGAVADARGTASYAALPLESGGVRRGVLAFGFSRPRTFSTADRALLDDLARQAAFALERAQLTADLEASRERAEEASRAKDEFLAMLGHELRNPLSPMVTVLHLLERRSPDAFPQERDILWRQLRHMERLVDDLLDVSRIVRGKLQLRVEALELSRVVADAVEAVSPLVETRRHHLAVEVGEGLVLEADHHRMVQVFVNLLTNAAKYTPPGGHLSLRARAAGDRAVVDVSDDGQGIEAALLPRLFDLFVQGPRGLARSEGGLGLGLAIVKSLVELHGGRIDALSGGKGRGSTFTVELPLSSGAPGPSSRSSGFASSGTARVLVVDDNDDAAETLADVLRCSGYDVRTAHDPRAALATAGEFLPEVAVIDIGLPGMDGWTLGAKLREELGANAPHCIAVTGYGSEMDRTRSQQAGFVAHLVKPLQLERLDRILGGLAAARGCVEDG
jgi:signal transduction histidine kinase/ActR/RegA family two-component response regulator